MGADPLSSHQSSLRGQLSEEGEKVSIIIIKPPVWVDHWILSPVYSIRSVKNKKQECIVFHMVGTWKPPLAQFEKSSQRFKRY